METKSLGTEPGFGEKPLGHKRLSGQKATKEPEHGKGRTTPKKYVCLALVCFALAQALPALGEENDDDVFDVNVAVPRIEHFARRYPDEVYEGVSAYALIDRFERIEEYFRYLAQPHLFEGFLELLQDWSKNGIDRESLAQDIYNKFEEEVEKQGEKLVFPQMLSLRDLFKKEIDNLTNKDVSGQLEIAEIPEAIGESIGFEKGRSEMNFWGDSGDKYNMKFYNFADPIIQKYFVSAARSNKGLAFRDYFGKDMDFAMSCLKSLDAYLLYEIHFNFGEPPVSKHPEHIARSEVQNNVLFDTSIKKIEMLTGIPKNEVAEYIQMLNDELKKTITTLRYGETVFTVVETDKGKIAFWWHGWSLTIYGEFSTLNIPNNPIRKRTEEPIDTWAMPKDMKPGEIGRGYPYNRG